MFKRVIWFTAGAASGAAASVYGYVRLREARGRLAPERVADTLVGTARTLGSGARTVGGTVGTSVREAVAEGRAAMADAESRIIAELDARPQPLRRFEPAPPDALPPAGTAEGRRRRAQ
jgi:hypothetical protein